MLTRNEIQMMASRPGVKRVAIVNFLGTLEGLTYEAALWNLDLDTRLYRWDYPTRQAIRDGIKLYFEKTLFDRLMAPDG
jgi:hypothetical protein